MIALENYVLYVEDEIEGGLRNQSKAIQLHLNKRLFYIIRIFSVHSTDEFYQYFKCIR